MNNNLTIDLGQGSVIIPMRSVALALAGQYLSRPNGYIPSIGSAWPGQGGIYAGMARGRYGEPDYHLIVGPESDERMTWDDAKQWATEQAVDCKTDFRLPTRKEQALMFANVSELFKEAWYWSCEQHAGGSGYAWVQGFGDGGQFNVRKSDGFRVRAVRRLVIQ